MVVNVMDRTDDFKKAAQNIRKGDKLTENRETKPQNLFSSKRRQSDFSKKAKEIVASITGLRDFLLQFRNAYINSNRVFGLSSQTMSDYERDKIDEEAQNIMKKCNEAINALQQDIQQGNLSEQVCTHRQLVVNSVQSYLKTVCKVYSEQRAIRVKSVVDKKRISRLHNPDTHKKKILSDVENAEREEPKVSNLSTKYAYDESDDELSETEAAALEQENTLLFNDMNSMVDEVRAIEGKAVEIARLQEIFSEQVLQQEGDIEMISEKVVEGTENIKDGNEELREAIKNNAGFRVWILFFLLMCSFSLLFLEWYS